MTAEPPTTSKRTGRLLGWPVLILGSAGFLASVVVMITIVIYGYRFERAIGSVFSEVAAVCSQVEERAQQAVDRLGDARQSVQDLDQRLGQGVADVLDLSEEDVAEVSVWRDRIVLTIQRSQDWIALSRSIVDFIEHVAGMAESVASYFGVPLEARAGIATALEAGEAEISKAGVLLEEVGALLVEVRAHGSTHERTGRIRTLSERIDMTLAELQRYVETFADGVGDIASGVESVRKRIRRAILISVVAILCLMTWQAAAQLCLAGWGRRRIAPGV